MLATTQLLPQLSVLSLALIRDPRGDPSLCPNIGVAAATLLFPLSVCMSSCIRLTLKISITELPSSSFLYRMRAAEIITYQNQNYFCYCSLLSVLQIFCLLIWGFLFDFGFAVIVLFWVFYFLFIYAAVFVISGEALLPGCPQRREKDAGRTTCKED